MNTVSASRSAAPERVSIPVPQAHPERLATIAKIFGVNAAPVNKARVLEIGSADGGNLNAAAYTLPGAKFVGLDESASQVDKAKNFAKELGLKNVEYKVCEGYKTDDSLGEFDYIIANGVFSWVGKDLQDRVLELCSKHLKADGVAFVSYNTYPGWHFRGMIRDMMRYHAGSLEPASLRAGQARALLDFLAQSVPVENNAYGILLRAELGFLSSQPDAYLLQDIMADANEPFYFHQFIERANAHSMQYLGEAEFSTMLTSNMPATVDETLRRISNDIVRTEQYMDFVRNRTFRQTLLCKTGVNITRNIDARTLMPLVISSPLRPEKPDLNLQSTEPASFTMPNGLGITTANPLTKAAFMYLAESWPRSVTFEELHSSALSRLSDVVVQESQTTEVQKQVLANDLLSGFAASVVLFRTEAAPFVTHVSERPKASELAKLQAPNQEFVSNQLHEVIAIDAFSRQLLQLLNGKRDQIQILDELVELVNKGQLTLQKDGKNISEPKVLRKTLEGLMQETLERMAKAAVLIA